MSEAMDAAILKELRASPELFDRVAEFKGSEFRLQKLLRADYPEDVVRAALTLVDLRRRAVAKFTRGAEMWFDREALEQSTGETVARHKAQRFVGDVIDLCTGMGGDAIALAAQANVVSVDRDHSRLLCAGWNAELYGVADRLSLVNSSVEDVCVDGHLVHVDPDRRAGRRGRSLRIEDLAPGPDTLQRIRARARGGAIKLSPASNFRGWFDEDEVELVSLGGECKEATVWFGDLRGDHSCRATVLPSGETIAGDLRPYPAEVGSLGQWVFDPDPSVVRAGLLDQFCEEAGLLRLDEEDEYLTADGPHDSGFIAGAFAVLADLPHDIRAVRRCLADHNVGRVEIKTRRIPLEADRVRKQLKLKGKEAATVIFARCQGSARALVCRRYSSVEAA